MAQIESYITLSVSSDGKYELSVSNKQGYDKVISKELTYDEAYGFAQAADRLFDPKALVPRHFARNEVYMGEENRNRRLRELRESRDRIDKAIAELSE